jgi:hypothetical protein
VISVRKYAVYGSKAALVSLIALSLSACAGPGRKATARVSEIQRAIDEPLPLLQQAHPISLAELINRAQLLGTAALRAEINGLSASSNIDDQIGASMPTLALSTEVGRTSFVRRKGQSDIFSVLPTVEWDFVRLFQRKRLAELRTTTDKMFSLQRRLADDDAELETVRRYATLVSASNRREVALARRTLEKLGDVIAPPQDGVQASPSLDSELERATQAVIVAEAELRLLCKLGPNTSFDLARPAYELPTEEALGAYIQRVLANNAVIGVESAKEIVREGELKARKAERWNGLSVSTSVGNLSQILSASPLVLLSYTYKLFDQGAQRRQELRAQAELLLAKLDRRDATDRLALSAGQIWLHSFMVDAEVRDAEAALQRAKIQAAVARDQYTINAIEPALYLSLSRELIDARGIAASKRIEALFAATELRLLATPPERDNGT